MNVLLVIVDCLRYDTAYNMPFLNKLGWQGYWAANHWSTSHCTDPGIMDLISGKHPDELKLWSMMFDEKDFVLPETRTIFHLAAERGYDTAFITNLQRWYGRGVAHFCDSRHWSGERVYARAKHMVHALKPPWLMVLHTADMHTAYHGGSYQAAANWTNGQLAALFAEIDQDETVFMVTADHGEGLGQKGPDGREVLQHGYGLWDFLTHIPWVVWLPEAAKWPQHAEFLTSHWTVHRLMEGIVQGNAQLPKFDAKYVFQAGATPKYFHRGVVDRQGRQFVRCTNQDGSFDKYWIGAFADEEKIVMENELRQHCARHGMDYGKVTEDEQIIIDRLRGLGYWE